MAGVESSSTQSQRAVRGHSFTFECSRHFVFAESVGIDAMLPLMSRSVGSLGLHHRSHPGSAATRHPDAVNGYKLFNPIPKGRLLPRDNTALT